MDSRRTNSPPIKVITYARNGIPEYWVIDLKNKKLIVHTDPQNDKYTVTKEFTSGSITSQTFPNIQISLNKLLLY